MSNQKSRRNFFSPPVFPGDETKTRLAYYLSILVPAGITAIAVLVLVRIRQAIDIGDISNLILITIGAILFVAWVMVRLGSVRLAAYMTVGTIWVASTFLALSGSGIRGTGFISYFVVMLLAGLLLGSRAAAGIALLSALSGFAFAYAEAAGIIPVSFDSPFVVAVEFTFLLVIGAIILGLIIDSLQSALTAAKENASELTASNNELSQLRDDLELRIQERTSSLEKRASQLEIVSSLARSITSIQDLDSLLPSATRLVSEQLNFYHTGIFLLDERGERAVLKAANSEGGSKMLSQGHSLPLDTNSIVGYVGLKCEPRIALDVGADSVYFDNPNLPKTRSEMALPLRAGDRLIGVLDVQSTEKNAFAQEDIAVLSTLADQIAVAIENARLHDENRRALAESRSTFERYVRQEWNGYAEQARHTGFVYDGKQILPLDKKLRTGSEQSASQINIPLAEKPSSTISLPIKLRGQIIGILDVRSKLGERAWTKSEISLLEAAVERAGLALENARLVESAQRRASRERSISEMSARIGAVSDIDSILQTAVEELGRKLSNTVEVTLELDPEQG